MESKQFALPGKAANQALVCLLHLIPAGLEAVVIVMKDFADLIRVLILLVISCPFFCSLFL